MKLRWWIFVLLMLLNMVNNLDRQVFAIVAPSLQRNLGWTELEYGRMVSAFQLVFAVMNLVLGPLVDRLGARLSMAAAVLWFSVAQLGHCFARTSTAFLTARLGLGFGEAPVYPATLKALAEWAPRSERGTAAGVVHFGVMLGAIFAPLTIPWMTETWGWQSGFALTGCLGLIVLAPWLALYHSPERHPRLNGEEQSLILESRTTPANHVRRPWFSLLGHRQVWAYIAIQSVVNPAWWFIIYWLPKFLGERFAIHGVAITPYLTVVYAVAGIGALGGGAISQALLRNGFSINAARKLTMFGCGIVMPVVIIADRTHSAWVAILVIATAAIVHQTWTATGAAVLADLIPPRSVGSVVGLGSFCGSLAGVVGAEATGRILQANSGHYGPMFVYAACAYLATSIIVQFLVPRMQPAIDL